jgi:hypothetical protein
MLVICHLEVFLNEREHLREKKDKKKPKKKKS